MRPSTIWADAVALAVLTIAVATGYAATSASAAADFMPLAAGMQWTYRELIAGQVAATEEWRVGSVNGATYQIEVQTLRFDSLAKRDANGRRIPAVNEEFLVVDAQGIARTQRPGAPEIGEYIIRNPVAVGTRWGDERNRCRITAVGVTEKLAAATYADCVEVTCEAGNPTALSVVSHFARDVGLVSQRVRASAELLGGALGTDVSGLQEERGAVESMLLLQNPPEGRSRRP